MFTLMMLIWCEISDPEGNDEIGLPHPLEDTITEDMMLVLHARYNNLYPEYITNCLRY